MGLQFPQLKIEIHRQNVKTLVTEEGARTLDHKVKSLALYQLSYSGPCLRISSLECPRMIWVQVTSCYLAYFNEYKVLLTSSICFVHVSGKPHERDAASADCSNTHYSRHQRHSLRSFTSYQPQTQKETSPEPESFQRVPKCATAKQ